MICPKRRNTECETPYACEMGCMHISSPLDATYAALIAAARAYAPHMDQWDKFKFRVGANTVYVTISLSDPWPDSFEEISP